MPTWRYNLLNRRFAVWSVLRLVISGAIFVVAVIVAVDFAVEPISPNFSVPSCGGPFNAQAPGSCAFNFNVSATGNIVGVCPYDVVTTAFKSPGCCNGLTLATNCSSIVFPDTCELCAGASLQYIFSICAYVNLGLYGLALIGMVYLARSAYFLSLNPNPAAEVAFADTANMVTIVQIIACAASFGVIVGFVFWVMPPSLIHETLIASPVRRGMTALFVLDIIDVFFWIFYLAVLLYMINDPAINASTAVVFGWDVARQVKDDHPGG